MLSDGDPQAIEMMSQLREAWDNAPTVSALDGASGKLAGYLVPLDPVKGELKQFLLVPYFGACIHTPPPPANQIVHVLLAKPIKGFKNDGHGLGRRHPDRLARRFANGHEWLQDRCGFG